MHNDKNRILSTQISKPTVGTLTFHEAINYGAILQAYALQRAILQLGYSSEIINYSCPAIKKRYGCPNTIKSRIGWLFRLRAKRQRKSAFKRFLSMSIRMSEPINRDGLPLLCKRYTSVIVGSDQVWNPELTGSDTTYFLDFPLKATQKKSYAASIGLKQWDDSDKARYAAMLNDFDILTIREETSAHYIERLLGRKPIVVCDPTFLLSRCDWERIATKQRTARPYVLLYCFGKPEKDAFAWSKKQAAALGCELVVMNLAAFPILGVKNIRGAGPEDFLGWIMGAKLVVTHSFHAICFSIIFERDFCWFNSATENAGIKGRSSRIEDLLERLGLENRAVNANSDLPASINFRTISNNIASERSRSLSILKDML